MNLTISEELALFSQELQRCLSSDALQNWPKKLVLFDETVNIAHKT